MHSNTNTYFSEEFVEKIPDDLIDGVKFICKEFFNNVKNFEKRGNLQIELFAAYAVLHNFLNNHNVDSGNALEFTMDINKLKDKVNIYFRNFSSIYNNKYAEREAHRKFEELNAKISSKYGNYILYELTENQIQEIQNLINELRNKINECEDFEDFHKQRILKKLEKLQSEVHKKMTDFDRIFGFVVEMRYLYENYKESKPLFDLSVKIANIALDAMALANGLPAPSLFQLT